MNELNMEVGVCLNNAMMSALFGKYGELATVQQLPVLLSRARFHFKTNVKLIDEMVLCRAYRPLSVFIHTFLLSQSGKSHYYVGTQPKYS